MRRLTGWRGFLKIFGSNEGDFPEKTQFAGPSQASGLRIVFDAAARRQILDQVNIKHAISNHSFLSNIIWIRNQFVRKERPINV